MTLKSYLYSFVLFFISINFSIAQTPPVASGVGMTGVMKRSHTLTAVYLYSGDNPESGTTIQWIRYTDNCASGPVIIATAATYNLAAADEGMHIAVRITPRDNLGNLGVPVEYRPWSCAAPSPTQDIGPNPVLVNTANCSNASGVGVPIPGNLILNPGGLCSPRAIDWQVEYTGINYSFPGSPPRIIIDWADGNIEILNPVLQNPGETNMSKQRWRVVRNHVYDYDGGSAASTTVGQRCTYTMRSTWGVGGNNCGTITAQFQTQPFTVWDMEDNTDLGTHDINHDPTSTGVEVGENVNVCQGDTNPIRLRDNTDFNCTPPLETPQPNDQPRWVQFVYGTASNITAPGGAGGSIIINGVSYSAAQLPVYGRVIYQASPTLAPIHITDDIQMPTTAVAGQQMTVTMRTWNVCNAFDRNTFDGNGLNPPQAPPADVFNFRGSASFQPQADFPNINNYFANAAPVLRNYTITIITKPNPPTVPNIDVCNGQSLQMSVNPTVGGLTYRWYSTLANALANTSVLQTGATYTPAGGAAPTAGQRRHYFVTATAANGCVSDPTEVTLTRRSDLPQPPVITGPTNLCPGGTFVYSLPSPPAPVTITDPTAAPDFDLNTEFQWTVPASVGTITSGQGTQSITITAAAGVGSGNVSVVRRYVTPPATTINGSQCPSTARTLAVNVRARPTANITPDPANICEGSTIQLNGNPNAPFGTIGAGSHLWGGTGVGILDADNIQQPTVQASTTSGTYNLAYVVTADFGGGVFCSSTVDNSVVNVSANPTPASTGPNQDLCFAAGPLVSNPLGGSSPGVGTGTWTKFSGPPGAVVFTPNANTPNATATAPSNGIYVFRWTVENGSCSSFDDITVDYGTAPPVSAAGADQDVCGSVATLNGNDPTFATGTWTQTAGPVGGTSLFAPNAITRNATVTVNIPGTYTYRWRLTSGTCAPSDDFVDIIFRNPPTVTAPADFITCLDNPPTPAFHVNLSGTFGGGASQARWEVVSGTGTFQSSGAANGNFDNANPVDDVYRPSAGDFTAGSVQLRLITDDPTGACTAVNDPITITFDRLPSPAAAGADFATCDPNTNLNATPANNGGTGTWSIGNALYYQTFTYPDGTGLSGPNPHPLTFNHPDGWTITAPDANTLLDNSLVNGDYLRVQSGVMQAHDVNAELVWRSPSINITALPNVTVSIQLAEFGNMEPTDYIRAFYRINAGAEILIGEIVGNSAVDAAFNTFSVSGLTGNSLEIVVRVLNNANDEIHRFDNVFVSSAGATLPLVADINNPTSAVTGLSVGNTTFTWTVTSALGVCSSSNDQVIVTRHALPDNNDPLPALCEDAPGSGDATVTLAFLNSLNDAITGIAGSAGRTVQYFTDAGRTIVFTGPDVVSNSEILFTRVTRTDVAPGCTQDGFITFTVNPSPVVVNQNPAFCEEAIGGNAINNVDLTFYNAAVANGIVANRSVAWFTDVGLTSPVASPTDVDNVNDGETFFARVTNTLTNCVNVAEVEFRINPRPGINPIIGGTNVCVGPTTVLYQIQTINAGATYTWNLPPDNPGIYQRFAGGGVNDFFVLLQFPGLTNPPNADVYNLSVTEISADGCVGDPQPFTITVESSPAANVIVGPNPVCKQQTGVVYQTASSNPLSTYTWSVIAGDAAIVGAASGVGLNQVTVDFGTSNSATLRVQEVSPTGCSGAAATLVINANDRPVMTSLPTASLCSGQATLDVLTLTSSIGGSTFNWIVTSVTGLVSGTTVGNNGTGQINQALTNFSGAVGSVTYRVTPTSPAGCAGPTQDVVVTVNPAPVIASGQTRTICSNQPVNKEIFLSPLNLPPGTVFNWAAPVMSDASVQGSAGTNVGAGAPGTFHITDVLVNTSIAPITATYTITPTSGAGCTGVAETIIITINPEPTSTNSTAAVFCSDVAFSINPQTNITNGLVSSFTWTAFYPAGLTGGAGNGVGSINESLTNITTSQISAVYTVTPTSASGCAGATFTVTVPVNPKPVGANTTVAVQCSDVAFSFDPQTFISNGVSATFTWTASYPAGLTGGAANGVGNVVGTLVNQTNIQLNAVFTVTPTSTPDVCVGTPFTITVPINPEPVGANSLKAVVCSDAPFSFDPQAEITNGVPASFTWTAVYPGGITGGATNGSGPVAETLTNLTGGVLNVVYTITPRSANNCDGNPFTITVPIDTEPVGADVTKAARCSNVPFSFNPQDDIINGVNSTFTWTASYGAGLSGGAGNGNGLIAETLVNLTSAPINAVYTVVPVAVGGGCVGNPPFIITVPVNPQPVAINQTKAVVCSNDAFSFDPQTQITNGVASNFSWTAVYPAGLTGGAGNGTGNVAETLVNLTAGQLSAVYTVTPTSVDGCVGANFTITVPINPEPVGANVTKGAACSNVQFSFNPQLDITNGVASNFTWTAAYAAGLTGGANNGTGAITETLENVTGGTLNAVYTVTPTSAASCPGATFTITVPVNPEPVGANDIKPIVCSDVAFNFNPQTDITNGVTSTFTWTASYAAGLSGGAGAGVGNIAETLTNLTGSTLNATYTITPTSTNGCVGNQFTITVPIDSEPVAANSTKGAVCSDTPFSFDPQNEITNGTTASFTWTAVYPAGLTGGAVNGVGVISQTLTNQTGGQLSAVYTITPTTAGSCVGTNFTITVPVNPEPVGSNAVRPPVCSDGTFNFNPQSDIINGVTSTFAWTASYDAGLSGGAGAGAGLLSETLTNLTGGQLNAVYTITPTSNNGCEGSPFTITVQVNPEPVGADAVKAPVCSDVAFSFNPQVEITNGVTSTFSWTAAYPAGITGGSGNGNGAVAETLTNLTSAQLNVVYTVTPTSSNGCAGATFTITVPIDPEPLAINTVKLPVCSDTPFSFDPQDNVSNSITATYTWTAVYDPGLTGGSGNGTGLIAEALNNVSGGTLNAVYTITPTSTVTNCVGSNFTITVPVRSEPVGADATKGVVCSDVPFSFNPQLDITNGIASTFTWTALYDAGISGGAGAGAGAIAENLNNTSGGVLNAVYTVTPTSNNGCPGTPFVITVPVSSEPVGANATKPAVCSNEPFSFDPQDEITNGIISTFTWTAVYDFGLTGGAANGNGNVTGTLQNLTGGVLNAVFTLTPASGGSCPGSTFTITVPVNPQPVGANVTRAAVCSDVPFNLNPQDDISNLVPSTFTWTATYAPGITGGAGAGVGPLAETLHNETGGPLNAVYTVTPTSNPEGCVGNPFVITVPVNPEPVLNPNLDVTVCSDVRTNIVLSTNGLSVPAAAFNIININVAGGLTPAAGNSSVQNGVNANAILNDRFTNTTNGSLTVEYTIVPVSAQGCLGDPAVILVTVDPKPVIDPALSPLPACSDVTTGVLLAVAPGSVPAVSYNITQINWDLGLQPGPGNASIGNGQAATAIQNDFFTNTTNSPLQARYRVVPVSADGCLGDEGTVIFTVNPAPSMATNLNALVCSNEASNIILGTSPTSALAANYDIMSIVVDGGLTPITFNGATPRNTTDINEIRNDVFVNNTNGVLTVTYSVVPITAAGCRGPERAIVLRVEPAVIAAPVNNTTDICSNTLTNIVLNSPTVPSAGIITFNYQAFASSGLVSGFFPIQSNLPQGHVITDNLVNNDDTPQTVTYRITPVANGAKTGNGCLGNFVDVVVNIEPKPKVIVTPTQTTVCEGIPTGFSLTSTTVPSSGSVEFELVNVVATGGVTGFSTVGTIFTNNSMLNDILDNPTAVPQTVTYTLRPQAPVVGCVGDGVQLVVTVNPRPTITASSLAERICSGSNINITFTYDVQNTFGVWTAVADANVVGASPGAGSLLFQTLFNNSSTPGNVVYTVTPTSPAGCQGTPVVINVTVDPIPSVTGLPPALTVCDDNSINVPLNSPVAGTVFNWTATSSSANITGFTSPNSGNVINETLSNADFFPGTILYQITPTGPAPSACVGNPATMVVTVAPTVGGRWLTNDLAMCVGQTQFLVLQLDGQPPFTATYSATDANGTTFFPLTGLGNIRVIPVSPTLTTTYELTAVSDINGCPFTPAGETVTVTVGETDATFSIVGPVNGCSPFTAEFQYNQVAGVTYTWRWFDGTETVFTAGSTVPNATITHQFVNPSPTGTISYKVTLQTTLDPPLDICQDVHFETVSVFPEIFVNIFPDKNEICSGETINFFNSSIGAATHRWFYREQGNVGQELDVRTTQQVSYTFTNTSTLNPIIYEVVYVANNGNCPSPEMIIPITVYRAVVASFDEGTIPPMIGNAATLTFTNTSTPVDGADFSYEWDFGIGASPQTQSGVGPFIVDYTGPGPRDVSVTAINIDAQVAGLDCSNTFTKTINLILPPLVADFDYTPLESCFPASIQVTNNSTGNLFEWQLVDQNGVVQVVSNLDNPTFFIANPGDYTIFLRASNTTTGQFALADNSGIGANAMPGKSPVRIYPTPQAAFQARPTTLFVPDTELVTFNFSQPTNVPSDEVSFLWNFGDTDDLVTRLLGESDPTYFYPVEGRYTITLVMQETRGNVVCRDTATQEIIAREGGQVRIPNAFTPDPSGPNGGVPGPGGVNDVFLPYVRGININEPNSFNMQIFDRWGNLIFESRNSPGQPLRGWDGYDRNGNLLPAGVYVYKLVLRLVDGQRTTQIGDVTLIR